jgi:hypothetical protein
VLLPTPAPPTKHDGLGAGTSHTGEPVGRFKRHQRRNAIAALVEALLDTPPSGTLSGAWETAGTQAEDAIAIGVRAAAGRRVVWSFPPTAPGSTRVNGSGARSAAR